jgi:5-(carboxyamino)imidazole ribonucleotide synthase
MAVGSKASSVQARVNMGDRKLLKRIGVIGGGQLAWMMAIAAKQLGLALVVQAASKNEPAAAVSDRMVIGEIDDFAATKAIAQMSDAITFENEFVNLKQLAELERVGVKFLPTLKMLGMLVDKYTQRQYLKQHHIPTPNFLSISDESDLIEAAQILGYPSVLKARRHGYDGKGTSVVKSESELLIAWEAMGKAPALLEAYVNFKAELAVMVARSESGARAVYPVVETQQVDQVCRRTIAPARVAPEVTIRAKAIAKNIVSSLDLVGIYGIELFLSGDDEVSVNEIAPRTHNSGHYTIEACETSQFAQLLRVVSGMPLGKTHMTSPVAIMVNLLGYETSNSSYPSKRQQIAQLPNTSLHWYGKSASKPRRKLGHATVLAENYAEAEAIADRIEKIWYEQG